ncbi:branched-subunit amino acid aminotransferase/4-amino-4-deoxychorismate lyase [Streptomyces griseochromogenes]|uniref:Aminotransferase n=1 Tax=Streptomyces griseochromogenes TaxID=68214 RepID=A0A1B1BBN9_9ACTN|nr:aminotransferase class IV family protein [Streptomyces griseochromogenes]ANP56217.1 aminotransferase [Streptomyces griseochromogenes]MBP2050718.1 branched-subunit amino acid aminotransferase/4-amino-4-deoxychorismate lyase [Streptomyces griseochromogenes]
MVTLDGQPVTAAELAPLALTNVGHFTSMRVGEDGTIRGLSLHMERLVRDCKAVWGADLDAALVRDHVRQGLEGQDGPRVVRVTVFDPKVEIGHLTEAGEPHVLVSVRGAGGIPPEPLRVMSVAYERDLPEVKHVGLFGALRARRTAQLAGYGDALFVGRDGLVSEGVTWNVAFVDGDGTVVWPQAPVLPGVTMALLRQHAPHRVATVTLEQAKGMRAAFATNTGIGVRAIAAIDETELPVDHPVLRRLGETYLSIPGESP